MQGVAIRVRVRGRARGISTPCKAWLAFGYLHVPALEAAQLALRLLLGSAVLLALRLGCLEAAVGVVPAQGAGRGLRVAGEGQGEGEGEVEGEGEGVGVGVGEGVG